MRAVICLLVLLSGCGSEPEPVIDFPTSKITIDNPQNVNLCGHIKCKEKRK